MRLSLTKHHGLGNDFLVLFDDQELPASRLAALARRLCDRRRGIGADGLILGVTAPDRRRRPHHGAPQRRRLPGRDERQRHPLPGPGLGPARPRSPSQTVVIATDAGRRAVEVGARSRRAARSWPASPWGAPEPIAPPAGWDALGCDPARPVAHLSLGNPHAVVAVDDVDDVDLAALGALVPDVNLEVVAAGPEPGAITMRVHERGAGITEACGTGAGAAAHAARAWGLADAPDGEITVHMTGGDAKVRVGNELVLIGPATYIARLEVPT